MSNLPAMQTRITWIRNGYAPSPNPPTGMSLRLLVPLPSNRGLDYFVETHERFQLEHGPA